MDKLIPSEEQEQAISAILASPSKSALNASDLGTGKTLVGVEVALRMGVETILITSPLNVRYNWQETIEAQSDGDWPVKFIDNKTVSGRAAWEDLKAGKKAFYLMGRELFRRMKWDEVKHIDLVVHDECTPLANRKNKSFKVAEQLRRRTGFSIAQSATWYGSNFGNAWGIGRILFPDVVERSYWAWVYNFCKMQPDRFDPTGFRVAGEKSPGAFANSFPCYINLRASATEPPLVQDLWVDLHQSQRRTYAAMEKKGVAWLEDHPLVARVPGVVHQRLRQVSLGDLMVTPTGEIDPKTGLEIEDVDFAPDGKSAKFDALKELLDDTGDEQVLVGTDSAKFARWVAARLPHAAAWTGDESAAEREVTKERFIRGEVRVIVATIRAIGEGVDGLQRAARIIVTLSEDYDPAMNTQFIGRLNRRGQERRVLVYHIKAFATRDDKQTKTLLDKALEMRQSTLKEAA